MKQEELMLGDYVQVNDEVCKVISISYFDIGISDSKEDFYHEHIDNIKPIPLTPEILEKNGFEYIRFGYVEKEETCAIEAVHQWRLENSMFALDDETWWRSIKDGKLHVKFGGFQLEYVHQLQHTLRLCGINKEIEI